VGSGSVTTHEYIYLEEFPENFTAYACNRHVCTVLYVRVPVMMSSYQYLFIATVLYTVFSTATTVPYAITNEERLLFYSFTKCGIQNL
jgi:hypothetical protein